MALNVEKEWGVLQRMTVDQLRAKYADVFGEEARSRHKQWLVKRIIWRMQANAEGDLSERARRRAAELANDADLRTKAPRKTKPAPQAEGRRVAGIIRPGHDNRVPMPGTILTRQYKGRLLRVNVLPEGFEFEEEVYKSLSAIAKAVTGSHWNGHLFFGLAKPGGKA